VSRDKAAARRRCIRFSLSFVFAAALLLVGPVASVNRARSAGATSLSAPGSYRQSTFGVDPSWLASNNDPRRPCVTRSFGFGWRNTTNASTTPGELGGKFARTSYYRAYYAEALAPTKSLNDHLVVSGTVRVPSPNGGGVLLGWFNESTSYDWRTPDFLGVRINGNGKSKSRLYVEYGTRNTFTPADLVETGVGLDRSRKKRYDFTLEYQPDQGVYGAGLLRLTVVAADAAPATVELSVLRGHRADGATFDHFGFLNVQLDGAPMTAYVGNLVIDGVPLDLSSAPTWEGHNNTLGGGTDCIVHDRQDFGYSATQFAGSEAGEIGGLVWRSAKRSAYYADQTENLTLENALYAEGKIVLESASSDSDLFLGWFNSTSAVSPATGDTPTNMLAADLGGPSRWGHRLFPVYHTSGSLRGGFSAGQMDEAPMLTPKHSSWQWWICYQPQADLSGNGRMTVGLVDSSGQTPGTQAVIPVPAQAKAAGAVFNRFGIRNLERGGHDVIVYLDDLRYTVGPGDVGPVERCGASAT
jgi:hypothetical protein